MPRWMEVVEITDVARAIGGLDAISKGASECGLACRREATDAYPDRMARAIGVS